MKKKPVFLIGLFIIVLLFSGCSSDKKIKNEMTLIMDTIKETEINQNFYYLIESLLTNEQDNELLILALDELKQSKSELTKLSIKTKKGKEVIKHYQVAFENREEVISTLKKKDFTEETKTGIKNNIIQAQESEYKATEILIKELKIKDIEKN